MTIKRIEGSFNPISKRGPIFHCEVRLTGTPPARWAAWFDEHLALEARGSSYQIALKGTVVSFLAQRKDVEEAIRRIDRAAGHANREAARHGADARTAGA